MTELSPTPESKPSGSLARDVVVLVLVGIALGVAHNAYLLGSGPGAGLSWIKVERALVRLEDVVPVAPDSAGVEQGSPVQPPAGTPAGAPVASAARVPTRDAHAAHTTPAAGTNPGSRPQAAQPSPAAAPTTTTDPTAAAAAAPADVPAIPETREPFETGLAIVRKLHAANAAVFVDARTAGEYAEGHIAGAVHISFDDVFRDPKRLDGFDDRGLPVVVYCGGGDCDLSRNLAYSMIDAGHKRVLVFLDGLPAWEQAGLPVNKGSQP